MRHRHVDPSRRRPCHVSGIDKHVHFVEADDVVNDAIDRAYRARTAVTPPDPVGAVVSAAARATETLVPRATA